MSNDGNFVAHHQVRVKVLSPNPQLLRLGQLLAKPREVVPKENNLRLELI
jgi:hypothetical protein